MKLSLRQGLAVCLLALSTSVWADIRQQHLQFKPGETGAQVTGKIKGDQTVDYQLGAKAGQTMEVRFKPSNASAYFNVLPPGSEAAIFIGSTAGNHFQGTLPANGTYTVRVYLMRSVARRNESSNYSLVVNIGAEGHASHTDAPKPAAPSSHAAFDKTLELQGIRFHVTSNSHGSTSMLHIVPSGLQTDNKPIAKTLDGTVTGAEVADLNADGSPEIYVYVTSAGSGSYGSLVAYSANHRKSLSEIYLPPITDDKKHAKGYMGHDQFAVLEGVLARRFPIYHDGDTNAKPAGKTRQFQYKLAQGEAGWVLKTDKVIEY